METISARGDDPRYRRSLKRGSSWPDQLRTVGGSAPGRRDVPGALATVWKAPAWRSAVRPVAVRLLLPRGFGLASSNAVRGVACRPGARHRVHLEVSDGARRRHLTRFQDRGIGSCRPDDAVSAECDNPNRDRIAGAPLHRPAFAVGGGCQPPTPADAGLRPHHNLALPDAANIGALEPASRRESGLR